MCSLWSSCTSTAPAKLERHCATTVLHFCFKLRTIRSWNSRLSPQRWAALKGNNSGISLELWWVHSIQLHVWSIFHAYIVPALKQSYLPHSVFIFYHIAVGDKAGPCWQDGCDLGQTKSQKDHRGSAVSALFMGFQNTLYWPIAFITSDGKLALLLQSRF